MAGYTTLSKQLKDLWPKEQSIFSYVSTHIKSGDMDLLPDESRAGAPDGSVWVHGAQDGMLSHHGSAPSNVAIASRIAALLKTIEQSSTAHSEKGLELYQLLRDNRTLTWLESFEQTLASSGIDPRFLLEIGTALAREAVDREAVKAGLAMASLVSGRWDPEIFLTLGNHEEFTLFAAVAIRRKTTQDAGDTLLLQLARATHGWGRIHCIERLDGSRDPLVRDWLLLEGYRNDIMHEYTALICARTINLVSVLQDTNAGRKSLSAAGDILASLLSANEQVADGIDVYEDGANACELWLKRLSERSSYDDFLELEDYPRLRLIHDHAQSEIDNPEGIDEHWFSRAMRIRDGAAGLLKAKPWDKLVVQALASDSPELRALAQRVRDGIRLRAAT